MAKAKYFHISRNLWHGTFETYFYFKECAMKDIVERVSRLTILGTHYSVVLRLKITLQILSQ